MGEDIQISVIIKKRKLPTDINQVKAQKMKLFYDIDKNSDALLEKNVDDTSIYSQSQF